MNDAPDDRPPAPTRRPMREQKWFVVLAACLAGVMIGYGLSGFGPETPDWKGDAAQHHSFYQTRTLTPLSPPQAELTSSLRATFEAVGLDLPLSAMTFNDALTPKRAQVLSWGGINVAHVLYEAKDGAPVSLFVKNRGSIELFGGAEMRFGYALATWGIGVAEFVLIGGDDLPQIRALSESFSAGRWKTQ